jgi:Ca2+-binding EF-hand superfamily protein
MKISLSTCALALAALLAAPAMAGDSPKSDASPDGPRGIMRADINGDGKVSKEEAAALHDKVQGDWFARTDTDGDGFLTQDEIRNARATRRDHSRGEMKDRMAERFKEADANNDGQISLDEAQAKMPRLAERFTALDTDKNGMLSKEELKRGGPRGPQPQN